MLKVLFRSKAMLLMRVLICLAPVISFSGCATVHSAFMTNISQTKGKQRAVRAEASKFVFLAFSFSNDFAFEAREKLISQCPNGSVTGILTTYETFWYVLFTNHVVKAQGVCL